MAAEILPLDTPRRISLQTQSTTLRHALKTYERAFARDHGGRKPGKSDIRADPVVQAQYRLYARVQDVLSGRVVGSVAGDLRSEKRTRARQDAGDNDNDGDDGRDLVLTKRGHVVSSRNLFASSSRGQELEKEKEEERVDDAPVDATPQHSRFLAIGPTPHRDGKVLGLFDLLLDSTPRSLKMAAATTSTTPSSSAKKRQRSDLRSETPRKRAALSFTQTPSRSRGQNHVSEVAAGDILDHLAGTPSRALNVDASRFDVPARYSRTPQSDGKKFLLSQFFATPSADRYTSGLERRDQELRPEIGFGTTPAKNVDGEQHEHETTPGYFRRSLSFKDRLLSASTPSTAVAVTTGPASAAAESTQTTTKHDYLFADVSSSTRGPPALRPFRSSTSIIAQRQALETSRTTPSILKNRQETGRSTDQSKSAPEHASDCESEDEDALAALAEIEGRPARPNSIDLKPKAKPAILVQDSQIQIRTDSDAAAITSLQSQLQSDPELKLESDADLDSDAEAALNRDIMLHGPRPLAKPYRKKGQKRMTRRSVMRPVATNGSRNRLPVFVASDATVSGRRVEQTAGKSGHGDTGTDKENEEDREIEYEDDEAFLSDDGENPDLRTTKAKVNNKNTDNNEKSRKRSNKHKEQKLEGDGRGKTNPNALSHTNFRSLKIRKKSSGGRRFGRRG